MFCGRYGSPAHDTHACHTDVGFFLVRNIRIYSAAFGASLQLRFDLCRKHYYIEGTKGMMEVPSAGVDISNLLPSVCCGRDFHQFRGLITYGLARLLHQHGGGVVGHVKRYMRER